MKKVLTGCGIALAILVVAGIIAGVVFGPKMVDFFKRGVESGMKEMEAETARTALLSLWTAPEGEALFPDSVGGGARTAAEAVEQVPGVSLPARGAHATYTLPSGTFDLYFFPCNSLEKEGIMGAFKTAYDGQSGGVKTSFTLGSRVMYKSTGLGENHLLRTKDGLLIFRPTGDVKTSDFITEYLRATATASPTPAPAQPGSDIPTDAPTTPAAGQQQQQQQ